MITAVLIDDEQHAIDRLKVLLDPYQDKIRISGTFTTVGAAIEGIRELRIRCPS
jgi:hypothetical protein